MKAPNPIRNLPTECIIAWLRAPDGSIAPVRLRRTPRAVGGRRTGSSTVERVVTLPLDRFRWEQVERLAAMLQARGFRLAASSGDLPGAAPSRPPGEPPGADSSCPPDRPPGH